MLLACNSSMKYGPNKQVKDARPLSQISFMKKLSRIQKDNYELSSNPILLDRAADSLKKYSIDSLSKVKDWEFIVRDINDNPNYSNPAVKSFFNGDVYNIELSSFLNGSKSIADTIAIDEAVNFIVTVPKIPKTKVFRSINESLSNLKPGDTVLVSGAVTVIDQNLKVNYAKWLNEPYSGRIDILPNSIKKKM